MYINIYINVYKNIRSRSLTNQYISYKKHWLSLVDRYNFFIVDLTI